MYIYIYISISMYIYIYIYIYAYIYTYIHIYIYTYVREHILYTQSTFYGKGTQYLDVYCVGIHRDLCKRTPSIYAEHILRQRKTVPGRCLWLHPRRLRDSCLHLRTHSVVSEHFCSKRTHCEVREHVLQ